MQPDGEPASILFERGEGLTADDAPWADSSVERELQVLLSHTVHHYALIAVALRLHGHPVDEEFGVAPSTLRYWASLDNGSRPESRMMC